MNLNLALAVLAGISIGAAGTVVIHAACHFSCERWFFTAHCSVSRSIAKNVLALG